MYYIKWVSKDCHQVKEPTKHEVCVLISLKHDRVLKFETNSETIKTKILIYLLMA